MVELVVWQWNLFYGIGFCKVRATLYVCNTSIHKVLDTSCTFFYVYNACLPLANLVATDGRLWASEIETDARLNSSPYKV